MTDAIDIENLIKTYSNGTQALKGVNLKIEQGDFFALLGANGAGKTTLINIVVGLVNKTHGHIRILGHNLDTCGPSIRKEMGIVPQEFNFNIFEKVEDIILSQAGYYGIDRRVAQKDLEGILKRLELWDKRNQPSRNLSGGMKRRLMIARALIHHPKLLILDEPTAGVDVELRHGMWEYLREINAKGTTILLTTHYLEEVEQMCRQAAIIKKGEIIACDRVKHLLQMVDRETYVLTVEKMGNLEKLKDFFPKVIDENTLELEIEKKHTLNNLVEQFAVSGLIVADMRPKGNRMEKLFLKILNQ